MAAPLLIDVEHVCEAHTDAGLEAIFKAIGEEPPDDEIWQPHPNPFIRRLVELFTRRGLDRVQGLREELARWIRGAEHQPDAMAPPTRPAGGMRRWDAAERAIARLYLRNLPPRAWALEDWMLLVDYLVQRYLPESDLRSEADWLATRSSLMGRVQAAVGDASEEEADTYLAQLPSVEEVGRRWGLTPVQRAVIEYGRARCAENVTALADAERHRMRRLIVDHQEATFLGDRAGAAESLQSKLLDEFGMLNRDWRRIAVTEATENAGQGFVAATEAGQQLRRVERYRGACPFCRSIDGRVVTVVAPDKADKDGDGEVWVGKTNVGRSASPRKRQGAALVEREPHERWWIAAGAQHPHCRGSWVRVSGAAADPEFEAWLKNLKERRA